MIDDDVIRESLEARAAGAPGDLAAVARSVAIAHPRPAGWRRWVSRDRWLPATTAGTALIVTVVVALALVGALGQRIATPAPPSSSASASTSGPSAIAPTRPQVEPLAAWSTLTWSTGDTAPFDLPTGNTYVEDATEWRGTWIAVGYALDIPADTSTGRVWTSPDGAGWSIQDGTLTDVIPRKVVGEVDRVTIVATDGSTGSDGMWSSSDGRTWAPVTLPQDLFGGHTVQSVSVGSNGWFVRLGRDGDDLWVLGTPGGGWVRLTPAPGSFDGAYVESIAAGDGVLLAVGMTGLDPVADGVIDGGDASNDYGAAWWSTDGVEWTLAPVERPGTSIRQLVRVAGGWIAVGLDHHGCSGCVGADALVWRSDDGRAWTPVDPGIGGPNRLSGFLVASDGRRAVGIDTIGDGLARTQQTTDGRTWTTIDTVLAPSLPADTVLGLGRPIVGPDGVVAFDHVSGAEGPEHLWAVPYLAVPGDPPAGGATQAPRPVSTDTVCEPAGTPCG